MTREVPRILRLSRDHEGAGHSRFALLHVVSGERHHLGWFELSDDAWRVGLTSAWVVADAGVPPATVRAETEGLLARLRAAHEAGELDAPEPVGPIVNTLRYSVDRGRAIDQLAGELTELEAV